MRIHWFFNFNFDMFHFSLIYLVDYQNQGTSLADREQEITRVCVSLCKMHGYTMAYVGDDPTEYGLVKSPTRKHSGKRIKYKCPFLHNNIFTL